MVEEGGGARGDTSAGDPGDEGRRHDVEGDGLGDDGEGLHHGARRALDGGSGVGGVEAVSFPDAWHIAGKAKVSGTPPRDVAKAFGVGRATLYRYIPGSTAGVTLDEAQP